MLRRPTIRSGAVFGVALGGLLAGHALTYARLAPEPTTRAAMLAATGHGYLHGADAVALAGALAGLAVLFLGRLTAQRPEPATRRSLATRLALFQIAGFIVLEVTERLSVGAGLGDLTRALPIGVVAQLTLALLSAGLLRWVLRIADRVADLATAAVTPLTASAPVVLVPAPAPRAPALAGPGNRGPPPLVT